MPRKKRTTLLNKITALKLDYVLLFVLMSLYYGRLQWNNFIGDPDGFYHAKITTFLGQGTLLKSLPWMQFTTLKEHYTDHHLLYHLLLLPFTYITDNALLAVKIATVLFAVIMILVFYWLLKQFKIVWPFVFALLFISLEAVSFRLALVKANSLSLLVIWLLIYAMFRQKTWLMALLGFVFVWLYGGWALSIIIFFIYFFSEKIYERLNTNKLKLFWSKVVHTFNFKKGSAKNHRIFLGLILGLLAGLVINPYWPHNLYFYYQQIIQIGVINLGGQLQVGGEWYGTSFMHIISSLPHIFVLASLLILMLFINYQKISKKTWFSFLLSFVFLLLTVKSRRYIEYFSPFLLLFTACAFTDVKSMVNWKKIKKFWSNNPTYLKVYLGLAGTLFTILILPVIFTKTWDVAIPQNWTLEKFRPGLLWLKQNTPADTLIFHGDWDEWPILFYHNDHNRYIVGLDPTFMYNFDANLQQEHTDITAGKIKGIVSEKIKKDFGADYVFIEKKEHAAFGNNLDMDSFATLVYEDEEVAIYHLISP
ncbi:hypothetical protein HOB10_05275 [Candidatus Parcubacteria bacterium]|jgi:hypothetical protein|nr:hypothetical protein [Candidatus Parcubacteria bacterium]